MASKHIKSNEQSEPNHSNNKRGLVRLTTGFSPDLVDRLRRIAKHYGTDVSCHVQMAVGKYVDEAERDIGQLRDRK